MQKTAARTKGGRSTAKTKDIHRKVWSRFCRTFSTSNRYREASLQKLDPSAQTPVLLTRGPLLGVAVAKKSGRIHGIDFFTDPTDPEAVGQPTFSITEPKAIEVCSGDAAQTLRVQSADGSKVELVVSDHPCDRDEVVRRMAYSLYERRQCSHGNDLGDWLSAERTLTDAEEYIVS